MAPIASADDPRLAAVRAGAGRSWRRSSRRRSCATARARPSSSPSWSKADATSTNAIASRARSPIRRWSRPRSSPPIPNLGPHRLRHRQRRRSPTSIPRAFRSGSTTRWSSRDGGRAAVVSRGRRQARDGESRNRACAWRWAAAARGDGVDLRSFARVRQHQRRLPKLMAAKSERESIRHCSRAPRRCSSAWRRCLPPPPPRAGLAGARVSLAQAWTARLPAGGRRTRTRSASTIWSRSTSRSATIDENTRQFVAGLPANNVLLTGSRGTGKSSLVKAMLAKYGGKGLRLIEVDKGDLVDLPDIVEPVAGRPERFIVFCDDLSFDANEPGYKALKVMLDGTIAAPIVERADLRDVEPAASASRILQRESRDAAHRRGSASRRIGRGKDLAVRALRLVDLVLSVQPGRFPCRGRRLAALSRRAGAARRASREALHREAMQFSLQRGSRSGRIAWQFARAHAGARALKAAARAGT